MEKKLAVGGVAEGKRDYIKKAIGAIIRLQDQ